MLNRVKHWARVIKRDVHAVYLAGRDPRVSWHAKGIAILVACYALSPIDLIPDFIPILGYLDDLIIVPLGIWVVVRLIPAEIMAEHRATAEALARRPSSKAGAAIIVTIWVLLAGFSGWIVYRHLVH